MNTPKPKPNERLPAIVCADLLGKSLKNYMLENYEEITGGMEKYPISMEAAQRLGKWLEAIPPEELFENGKPAKKPYYRRIANTCKCQGCGYCRSVLVTNAIQRARENNY